MMFGEYPDFQTLVKFIGNLEKEINSLTKLWMSTRKWATCSFDFEPLVLLWKMQTHLKKLRKRKKLHWKSCDFHKNSIEKVAQFAILRKRITSMSYIWIFSRTRITVPFLKDRWKSKFFHLDGRYDIIGTGSLLGVRGYGKEPKSIPVGYETTIDMSPLDFEEFLWAVCRMWCRPSLTPNDWMKCWTCSEILFVPTKTIW